MDIAHNIFYSSIIEKCFLFIEEFDKNPELITNLNEKIIVFQFILMFLIEFC